MSHWLHSLARLALLGLSIYGCTVEQPSPPASAGAAGSEQFPVADYEAAFEHYQQAQEAVETENFPEAARQYLTAARHGFDPEQAYMSAIAYALKTNDTETALDAAFQLAEKGFRDVRPFEFEDEFKILLQHPRWPELYARIAENKASYDERHSDPSKIIVETSDIDRFWMAFDQAAKASSFEERRAIYLSEYFRPGSVGLRDFTFKKMRSGIDDFVEFVENHRSYYDGVRAATRKATDSLSRLPEYFAAVKEVIPEATFSNYYFVIGRHTSFGTVSLNGSLIGLENVVDETTPVETLPADRQSVVAPASFLPFVLIHELIHTYQNTSNPTLLGVTIVEGGADLITELILGPPDPVPPYRVYGEVNEALIWKHFQQDMEKTSQRGWVGQVPAEEAPEPGWVRDLAYFVGYKIARAYYDQAEDKQQALKDLLDNRDPKKILETSGYGDELSTLSTTG